MHIEQLALPEQQRVEMATLYEIEIRGEVHDAFLTMEQWFHIFLHGKFSDGSPITWIQAKGQPGKRVTFVENVNG